MATDPMMDRGSWDASDFYFSAVISGLQIRGRVISLKTLLENGLNLIKNIYIFFFVQLFATSV